MTGGAVVRDLDRKDLRVRRLFVEPLHDATQLVRDAIGEEDESDAPVAQVPGDLGPEPVHVLGAAQGDERFVRPVLVGGVEGGLDLVDGPVLGAVGGVVEHLADDLAADPRVGRPLDLHEGRDRLLVHEQVVEAPSTRPLLPVRDAHLACHQQEPPGIVRAHLRTAEQLWVVPDQALEVIFGSEHGDRHRHPGLARLHEDHIVRHEHPPPYGQAGPYEVTRSERGSRSPARTRRWEIWASPRHMPRRGRDDPPPRQRARPVAGDRHCDAARPAPEGRPRLPRRAERI